MCPISILALKSWLVRVATSMQARKSFSAKSLVMKRAFVIWFTFKLTIMYRDDNLDKMSFAPKTIWFLTKLLCCYSRAKLTNCLLLSVFWNLEKYSSIAVVLKLSLSFYDLNFVSGIMEHWSPRVEKLKWGISHIYSQENWGSYQVVKQRKKCGFAS